MEGAAVSRWTFLDTVTAEAWTMPINPDSMDSPFPMRQFVHAKGLRRGLSRTRTFLAKPQGTVIEFGGAIRTKAHHDALEHWAYKTVPIELTDHLGRTWRVYVTDFTPIDRKPTARTPWRLRYSMKVDFLERIS